MKVLGLDTGFAFFGWGVVDISASGEMAIAAGCIKTKKSTRKVLAFDDNFRRGRELYDGLSLVIIKHEPKAIAVESMSWPRNAGVTAKLGIAWGVTIALATEFELPVVGVSPQELKRALTGSQKTTKAGMRDAVLEVPGFRRLAGMLAKVLPRGQHEHPIDAIAAVIATRDTDVMRTIRKLGSTL